MSKKNCSNIGGQAVLEGVMMRGKTVSATAVRDPYGNVQVESERFVPLSQKSVFFKIPIVRGVCSFVTSMIVGIKTLMRSSEVFGDDIGDQPTKFDLWLAKTFKLDIVKVASFIGLVLGLLFSVTLFIILPRLIAAGLSKLIAGSVGQYWEIVIVNLTTGIAKIAIFLIYLILVSRLKDIKRLFRYHGAEHKTIACYESGAELTVENVQKQTRLHDRCGTNFIFLVMIVSILFSALFFALLYAGTGWKPNTFIDILLRLAILPIIAGVSYEVLKINAKFDNPITRAVKAPGLALQKITTAEPDEKMIEVAIAAFETVLKMEADHDLPTTQFKLFSSAEKAKKEVAEILGEGKEREVELILMAVTGKKSFGELAEGERIPAEALECAKEIANKRKAGEPLQYAIGTACFYGYDFKVGADVLVPRFDTEILAEQAIKAIPQNGSVLELCTGSGAVAVTLKKEVPSCTVTATDISAAALALAKENAAANGAEITFAEGDLFAAVEGKYDVIIANPPYIPTEDIKALDAEVKDYEPTLALDGGADGLDFYRKIAAEYKNYLKEGGALLMELGIGQAAAVDELFGGGNVLIKDYNTPPVERVIIVK